MEKAVAIDPVGDIEYLLTLGTEDNLMIGTDYRHSDVSAYQRSGRGAAATMQSGDHEC